MKRPATHSNSLSASSRVSVTTTSRLNQSTYSRSIKVSDKHPTTDTLVHLDFEFEPNILQSIFQLMRAVSLPSRGTSFSTDITLLNSGCLMSFTPKSVIAYGHQSTPKGRMI